MVGGATAFAAFFCYLSCLLTAATTERGESSARGGADFFDQYSLITLLKYSLTVSMLHPNLEQQSQLRNPELVNGLQCMSLDMLSINFSPRSALFFVVLGIFSEKERFI